jgi:hypothetical protein
MICFDSEMRGKSVAFACQRQGAAGKAVSLI